MLILDRLPASPQQAAGYSDKIKKLYWIQNQGTTKKQSDTSVMDLITLVKHSFGLLLLHPHNWRFHKKTPRNIYEIKRYCNKIEAGQLKSRLVTMHKIEIKSQTGDRYTSLSKLWDSYPGRKILRALRGIAFQRSAEYSIFSIYPASHSISAGSGQKK